MLDLLVLYDLLSTIGSDEPVSADTFTFQSGNSTSRTVGHSRTMPRCALWGPKILLEAVAGGRVEAFVLRGLSVRVNPSLET